MGSAFLADRIYVANTIPSILNESAVINDGGTGYPHQTKLPRILGSLSNHRNSCARMNPSGSHLRYTTVIRARKSMRLLRCRRIASVSCRAAACSMLSPIVLIASNP
jgi:hypothetical protein